LNLNLFLFLGTSAWTLWTCSHMRWLSKWRML